MRQKPPRNDLVQLATDFAARKHAHQFRDDEKTPYIEHPLTVMRIVRDEFGEHDPEMLAAALLHDTIEDCGVDVDQLRKLFGQRVARLVSVLSEDKRLPQAAREREYLDRLVRGPLAAKICKVADVLHNLRDATETDRGKKLRMGRKMIRAFGSAARLREPMRLLQEEMAR
jgi:guanosine-3',5'-bis(diphosphate) 3'-pyrophosphohydrolase